VFIAMIPVW